MALFNCPECGKEVSDKSQVCIHCGYPLTVVTTAFGLNEGKSNVEKFVLLGDDLRTAERYPAAMDCYLKAAELGSAHAQVWVGNFYDRGLGVEKNKTEAVKWYKKAADLGEPSALCNLAFAYRNGIGVVQDIDKAIELNLLAIQKGSVTAAGNLGNLYENTTGEHQSYQLARIYYEQAISMGTTDGIVYNNLALIYAEGKGTGVDYGRAEQCYLKAIELGAQAAKSNYAVFANNRGVAYTDGKGVEKNFAKAEAYYRVAIKYGNQQAQCNYEALIKNRTASQSSITAPSTKSKNTTNVWVWVVAGIFALLLLFAIGSTSGSSDKTNTRTCPWCNGTGYNGNGAENAIDYVFKKTPCTHCGGDGKY